MISPSTDTILKVIQIIASLFVACVALFKEWILLAFFPPRLRIAKLKETGNIGATGAQGQTPAVYYHLDVVNKRKNTSANSCKITLVAFQKQLHNGEWEEIKTPVPPHFEWTPPESQDGRADIFDVKRFNFLMAIKEPLRIKILANRTFTEMDWSLLPNNRIRYILQIEGRNVKRTRQKWEVGWNGVWPYPDTDNISIQEIVD